MAEIKLERRVKYAGDIHAELLKAGFTPKGAAELLGHCPDADVAPVVHGSWIDRGWDGDFSWQIDGRGNCWHVFECSNCGAALCGSPMTPHCHRCGAKMDGGREDA